MCKTASFSNSLPSPSKCIGADDGGGADNNIAGGDVSDVDNPPTASMLANQNNMAVGALLGAAKNDGNLGGGTVGS